jgi:hypothetical protein
MSPLVILGVNRVGATPKSILGEVHRIETKLRASI